MPLVHLRWLERPAYFFHPGFSCLHFCLLTNHFYFWYLISAYFCASPSLLASLLSRHSNPLCSGSALRFSICLVFSSLSSTSSLSCPLLCPPSSLYSSILVFCLFVFLYPFFSYSYHSLSNICLAHYFSLTSFSVFLTYPTTSRYYS